RRASTAALRASCAWTARASRCRCRQASTRWRCGTTRAACARAASRLRSPRCYWRCAWAGGRVDPRTCRVLRSLFRLDRNRGDVGLSAAQPSLSIFFPAYNDAGTIASLALVAHMTARTITSDYEVIVVEDGSPDHTGALLDEMAKHFPWLKVVHHEKNQG